jgi:hypothetical protein
MAAITCAVEIARRPQDAFAYVTDPTRFVECQENVLSGHMDDDGPHGVGARCLTTRRIGLAERPVTSAAALVGRRSRS